MSGNHSPAELTEGQMITPGFTVSPAPDDVPFSVVPGVDYVVTRDSDGQRIGYVIVPGPDPEDGHAYEAHTAAGSGAYLGEHATLDEAADAIAGRMGDKQWPGATPRRDPPGPGQQKQEPEL